MDLNPDEAIAAGWLRERSLITRFLYGTLSYSLSRADRVVVLDRFMQQRIGQKGVADAKIDIIPPWSHDRMVQYDLEGRGSFRTKHALTGKFVVMYSGNHSPCHPLDTLLDAARILKDHSDIVFCFIGGGSEFRKVQEFARDCELANILCLPYQPLKQLSSSLSAADLHAVVLGDAFVGIVHPCKVYNILTLGIPILYVGPSQSHVTDMVAESSGSWAHITQHGEVDNVVAHILQMAHRPPKVPPMPNPLATQFSQDLLLRRFIAVLEAAHDQRTFEHIEMRSAKKEIQSL
jgi:glycosyltransferase involved in cell wall biosynthesis